MKRIEVEDLRVPSPKGRGGRRRIPPMKSGWKQSADSPGTYEDGRVRRNECESSEPLVGCLGRPLVGTAKAPHITCQAGKLWRAGEWGGWGRISDDGPGQHNLDRSEGPWGRAEKPLARRRRRAGTALRLRAKTMRATGDAKVGCKLWRGADRSAPPGKAPTDKPALEPYRGKPAVRNLRGDDGNVGIMRSPISAIVLPDPPQAGERDLEVSVKTKICATCQKEKPLVLFHQCPGSKDGRKNECAACVVKRNRRNRRAWGKSLGRSPQWGVAGI
jgi:hypothetical protein